MIAASLIALAAATLSLTAVRDSYPDLSPDGQTLVFHSNRTGKGAIWLAGADGSNPRMLYDGGGQGDDPSTPRWSPDGSAIVFAMRPAGAADENESDIYSMDRSGGAIRRLTSSPGDDSHPHWSADGRRIFFNSARATPDLKAEWGRQWIDIYSMAADGRDVRRHSDCRTVCTYPVPSPDGRSIAYRKVVDSPGLQWDLEPGPRNSEVVVAALGGSGLVNVSRSTAYDGWPMWSPSGRWLVFTSNRDKIASQGQIYAVRLDGSGLRRLTDPGVSRAQPSFSPDGSRLLVYENVEGEAFEFGHIAEFEANLPD